jgi:hypothetical protein
MNCEKIRTLAISETGFIFDPTTGNSYTSNVAALRIFDLLKEGKEQDEIIEEMMEEFEVERDILEQDIADFLLTLQNYRLIF